MMFLITALILNGMLESEHRYEIRIFAIFHLRITFSSLDPVK
jgi:hypothetical protein